MRVLPFKILLEWMLREFEERQSIFGIPRSLFYQPAPDSPFAVPNLFGQYLTTPVGPAAGPHTQLAQNIIAAWLSGARFIELKTVQVRDDLEIPRPCIDMEDEGYNVEWSQELKLEESAQEYIKAWVLIHVLHRLLGFEGKVPVGTLFNVSVGYDLEGIRSAPLRRFLDRMADASAEVAAMCSILKEKFPRSADIQVPNRIANNVTLSTMHGCPPEEIEQIACYLLKERGLHTMVKLNPTLLGRESVLGILHEDLGFREIKIPESVFEHDLQYSRAVELIKSLQQTAAACGLGFGVKLGNTLAAVNHKARLPGNEMYMSGRALYPLTINLFHKLAREFEGELHVSFSGGADALNVSTILACGAKPVTVVSDLLKPGGYSRLLQYLENIESDMRKCGAESLQDWSRDRLSRLETEARDARTNARYKKAWLMHGLPKVSSGLGLFDCIAAPCVEQCAVRQDVPEYARLIAQGEYDRALGVIMACNPLPAVTGYVCTQLCQKCCTRTSSNYEAPVAIRALKRFAAENGKITLPAQIEASRKVAIIGAGPSGLSAAYFLSLSGISATIFEAKDVAGGMMRMAPVFRLPSSIIRSDIHRIENMGVTIKLSQPVTQSPEQLLKSGFDAVYIASGFQKNAPMYIEGSEGPGVISALDFLDLVRRGKHVFLGNKVLVIGGGDTALDAARAAQRLRGAPVTVVYRRTRAEMPAAAEDQKDALEEGVVLEELVSPIRVVRNGTKVVALECLRNALGSPGTDGRRRAIPVKGTGFRMMADTIIFAVGQSPDLAFLNGSSVQLNGDGSIAARPEDGMASLRRVYAGGDVVRGPASIIEACADGRRAAEAICAEFKIKCDFLSYRPEPVSEEDIVRFKRIRARKEMQHSANRSAPDQRRNFNLIEATLSEEAARSEAARCVQCSAFCDKCVEVCPNRANLAFQVPAGTLRLPILTWRNGDVVVTGETDFHLTQFRQILHVHDLCNECGNCATFCVHHGKPFQDKPRLFLDYGDFAGERDNAFHIMRDENGWMILRRERGIESRLSSCLAPGELVFENDCVKVEMSDSLAIKSMTAKKPFSGEVSLMPIPEMYTILLGAFASLPFL